MTAGYRLHKRLDSQTHLTGELLRLNSEPKPLLFFFFRPALSESCLCMLSAPVCCGAASVKSGRDPSEG